MKCSPLDWRIPNPRGLAGFGGFAGAGFPLLNRRAHSIMFRALDKGERNACIPIHHKGKKGALGGNGEIHTLLRLIRILVPNKAEGFSQPQRGRDNRSRIARRCENCGAWADIMRD